MKPLNQKCCFLDSKTFTKKESILKRKVFLSFLLILLTVINAYSIEANQSVNSFDDKLFESLYSQDENVNYSSLSIYSLLYALAKGSDKQTFQQIKDVIDYTPSRDFDNQMLKLMSNTENMSNSLWYKNSLEFKDDYKLFMSDFNFTAKPVDFTKGSQVRKEINQFISNKTKKSIQEEIKDKENREKIMEILNQIEGLQINDKNNLNIEEEKEKLNNKIRKFNVTKRLPINQKMQITSPPENLVFYGDNSDSLGEDLEDDEEGEEEEEDDEEE